MFHRLEFAEAIARKLLTDYQLAVVAVDDATYRDWAQRGRFVTTDGTEVTDARTLAGQIGLAQAMRRYDLHRTITFHSRVKRAHEFAQSLPEVISWMPADQQPLGQVWSDYASGEMPAGQRHALLHHLGRLDHGQRGGLLATPAASPKASMSPPSTAWPSSTPAAPRSTSCRPSAAPSGSPPTRPSAPSSFRSSSTPTRPGGRPRQLGIQTGVGRDQALRSHDSQLGEHLDELRRQLGRQGEQSRLPSKIHLDLPEQVGADFARAFDVRLVEQTTATWEFAFGVLEQHVARVGQARIAPSGIVNGFKLGMWVVNQRVKHDQGLLDAEYERRLKALPGWTWDPFADQWEKGFSRLLEYIERHGNSRVLQSYEDDDRYQLGNWVTMQRVNYSNRTLDADRQERLQNLPGWSWKPKSDMWEEGLDRLLEYVEDIGNARIPATYKTEDGYKLGQWVDVQRRNFVKRTLTADRKQRLEDVPGWTWDPPRADKWEEGFSQLLSHVQQTGHSRVPYSAKLNDYPPLGTWVDRQRQNYAKDILERDRQRRLEDVSGWTWNSIDDQWDEGFEHLLRYVLEHQHARVAFDYNATDQYALGKWVARQRAAYTKRTLNPERQRRLEEVPGWTWDPPLADKWEEGFKHLADFVETHGHARVLRVQGE